MWGNRNNNRGGSGNRSVCRFFLEGRCKFGENCKFEHPRDQGGQQQNQNRFAPLNNQRNRSGAFGANQGQQDQDEPPFNVTADGIKVDLTEERPQWPLSAYGPGKNAPRQLLEGDFEQSPEEMRLLHYIALANGNQQETAQLEAATAQAMTGAIQKILSDVNGAIKYVLDGEHQHPNRIDLETMGPNDRPSQAPAASNGFGQPSTIGQASQPQPGFGQPSTFGQASQTQSGFGQPSNFGQAAQGQSSFGQPSSFGQATRKQPTFAQPSARVQAFGVSPQPNPKPGFGQPSFGQSGFAGAASSSPFAQNNTQQQGTFGAPSSFGAAANKPSPFAAASSQNQQPSGFGASPFAPAAQPSNQQPAFGSASPFGAAARSTSPFAQAAQAQQSGFGASSFGQQQKSSPFAQAASQQQPSGFGQPSQPSSTSQPFPQPNAPQAANAPSGAHLTHAPDGTLTSFKGHPVTHDRTNDTYTYHNPATGKKERIWHPTGPPPPNKDVQAPAEVYTGELGNKLKDIYAKVKETGEFEDGVIPEIPPEHEWIDFDF